MKQKSLIQGSLLIAMHTIIISAMAQTAETYALNWSIIAGGGGSSASGLYSLSGTVGEPTVGHSTGGSYAVEGGFWAVAHASRPSLRITRSGPNVILSWPNPSTSFQLQEATALSDEGTQWSDVSNTPVISSGEKQVTLPASGARFFRLAK
jgi:hypothetical protein